MKATMSGDGKLRFTMTVKHRVGLDDVVDALCIEMGRNEPEKFRATKPMVIKAIKYRLHDLGTNLWVDAEEYQHHREAAIKLATKLFPELKGK